MRLKLAVIFVLLLFFSSCHAGKKTAPSQGADKKDTQEIINPNLPTVTLEKVKPVKLHSVLRYGTYVKPKASYPVLQVADAVIRSIPVTVGTFVKEGDLLYSFQQVLPGTSFGTGWVRAKNTGYISLIEGVEGHTVKKDEIVLVISDFNSAQLNFYLSNQDVGRVKDGQEVYFAEYIDELDKIDQKLKLHLSEDTRESLLQQKKKVRKLLEDTKGKIIRMPIAPEEGLGVFNVQVDFPIHESLKIGRFVIIEMHVDPYEGLAVNQRNIQRRYGKQQVTVVHNNIVNYQEVEIGRTYGDMVVIKDGLKEGDEIVVATNRYIRPGVKVNVRRKGPKKPKEAQQSKPEQPAAPKEQPKEQQGKQQQSSPQEQAKEEKFIHYYQIYQRWKALAPQGQTEEKKPSRQEQPGPQEQAKQDENKPQEKPQETIAAPAEDKTPAPQASPAQQEPQPKPEQPAAQQRENSKQDISQMQENLRGSEETGEKPKPEEKPQAKKSLKKRRKKSRKLKIKKLMK